MREIERIVGQLKGSFDPGAWHGPSLRKLLRGVTAEVAAKQPAGGAHSIWELTLHIAAWERAAKHMLEGKPWRVSPRDNFPAPAEVSEAAWKAALKTLEAGHKALLTTAAALDDSQLEDIVPGRRFTAYFLLHGVVQHNLYHAGQIAILKRMLS